MNSLLDDALDTLGYIHKHNKDNYSSIAIICHEDLTEDIIKHLNLICILEDIDLNLEFIDFDKADYGFEYGIAIYIDDNQLGLSVEKAICSNGEYKIFDMDYVFVSKDCSDKLILTQTMYEGNMDIFVIDGDCD